MMKNSKTPSIRFKGFTDPWEQRELGDCFDEREERSSEGELISVTINDGIKKFSELGRHDNSSEDKSHYKVVRCGDIAYNSMRMWQGASGYSQYNGILSPAYTVLVPRNDVYSQFFAYVFKRAEMIHTFQICSQGITSDTWNLKYPTLAKIKTKLPKLEEQKKIADYFRNLDNLITLHQRKYDKLVSFKKAMLEKMFPKNDEKVPQIRFKGFTDPWEQRKFRDLFVEKREKTLIEYEDILLSCAINGIFLNSELFSHFRGTSTVGYLKVKINDLILSAQNLHLGNANVNLRFESGIISPAYKVYELNNCVPNFIQAWVKKENTKNFFLSATTEGASQCRKNIEWETLNKQFISVPKIEEQEKIGTFFSNLDNLITLHQRDFLHRKGDLLCQNKLKNRNYSVNILNAGLKCIRKELYERSP